MRNTRELRSIRACALGIWVMTTHAAFMQQIHWKTRADSLPSVCMQPASSSLDPPDASLPQEFHPYVFQIFAQLIELRPAPLPGIYLQMLPGLLSATFWERPGNIPALVRLLQAYMAKSGEAVVQNDNLVVSPRSSLGIFLPGLTLH